MDYESYKTSQGFEVILYKIDKAETKPWEVACIDPEDNVHWALQFATEAEARKEFDRRKD